MLRSADGSDKFLTVHRNRLKHCNSEPMPEQQIHHVEPPFEPALVAHQVLPVSAPQPAQGQQQSIDQAVDRQRELQPVEIVEAERQPQPQHLIAADNNEQHAGEQPQQEVANARAVASAPLKREIRPLHRLVDEYAPALVASRKEKKKK